MYSSTIYKPFFLSLMGVFVALCMGFSSASAGPLVGFGGVAATPTTYKVTVTKIEFFSGTWVTYFSGSCVMDIASVALRIDWTYPRRWLSKESAMAMPAAASAARLIRRPQTTGCRLTSI